LRHYSVYGADLLAGKDRYVLLGFAATEDSKIKESINRFAAVIKSF